MATMSRAGSPEGDAVLDQLAAGRRGPVVIGRPVPILKRVVRPHLDWDSAVPGLKFPPLEYTITVGHVAWFEGLRRRCGIAGEAGNTVPIGMFIDEPMQCIVTLFGRSGRLHAAHSVEIIRQVPTGSTVRSSAMIADRYERVGRRYVEVECTTFILEQEAEIPAIRTRATLVV
jgi:hypothetical protein